MTTNLNIDAERSAFEVEFGPKDNFAWRNADGAYKNDATQSAWIIWQRARASRAPSPAASIDKLHELLGEYWDIAYREGLTGVSRGTYAQEVLSAINRLVSQSINTSSIKSDGVHYNENGHKQVVDGMDITGLTEQVSTLRKLLREVLNVYDKKQIATVLANFDDYKTPTTTFEFDEIVERIHEYLTPSNVIHTPMFGASCTDDKG